MKMLITLLMIVTLALTGCSSNTGNEATEEIGGEAYACVQCQAQRMCDIKDFEKKAAELDYDVEKCYEYGFTFGSADKLLPICKNSECRGYMIPLNDFQKNYEIAYAVFKDQNNHTIIMNKYYIDNGITPSCDKGCEYSEWEVVTEYSSLNVAEANLQFVALNTDEKTTTNTDVVNTDNTDIANNEGSIYGNPDTSTNYFNEDTQYWASYPQYYICEVCGEYSDKMYFVEEPRHKILKAISSNYEPGTTHFIDVEITGSVNQICSDCGEDLIKASNSLLYKIFHYSSGRGDKAYICTHCGQAFGTLNDNPKEISCPECGQSESNKLNNSQCDTFVRTYPQSEYLFQ